MTYADRVLALTPVFAKLSISPESSDGFASVGTILPKEEAALLPGGLFVFSKGLFEVWSDRIPNQEGLFSGKRSWTKEELRRRRYREVRRDAMLSWKRSRCVFYSVACATYAGSCLMSLFVAVFVMVPSWLATRVDLNEDEPPEGP
jgi:hypothetical protein